MANTTPVSEDLTTIAPNRIKMALESGVIIIYDDGDNLLANIGDETIILMPFDLNSFRKYIQLTQDDEFHRFISKTFASLDLDTLTRIRTTLSLNGC